MSRLIAELKHAFAVGPDPDSGELTLPAVLERLAGSVVDRGMETPALIFIDSVTPLSFLASQTMHALWPLVQFTAVGDDFPAIAEALEDRRTVRLLAERIEELAGARGTSR